MMIRIMIIGTLIILLNKIVEVIDGWCASLYMQLAFMTAIETAKIDMKAAQKLMKLAPRQPVPEDANIDTGYLN